MRKTNAQTQLNTVERIARDIADGILLISNSGTIEYINPSAEKLLGNPALKKGITYAEYMTLDDNRANDNFHQYILDSIYDKDIRHKGHVTYTCPDGTIRYLNIEASFANSSDGLQQTGMILQFSDVTELHLAQIKQSDTIKILASLIAVLAVWNYVYMFWKLANEPISSTALTLIIEAVGIIGTVCILFFTSITWEDFGLGTKGLKEAVKYDSILTLIVLGLMIILKFIIQFFFPDVFPADTPFFNFAVLTPIDLLYIPTCVLQEFLTRGVIQGSLDRILPENYPPAFSIIVSSIFFGALHLHKGIVYMLGAAFLLSFFGVLYRKQKTIWGLCIPHLFLSWALRILFNI